MLMFVLCKYPNHSCGNTCPGNLFGVINALYYGIIFSSSDLLTLVLESGNCPKRDVALLLSVIKL